MCKVLDTAHKAPSTAIYTEHGSRLAYMASCSTQCACGYRNKAPNTNARRRAVYGKDEGDAASSE